MKIVLASERKDCARYEKIAKRVLQGAALALGVDKAAVEVHIVGDRHMKKNVLAYPAPRHFPRPDLKGYGDLGDIYINPLYIKRQGEDFKRMLIHGFLHLLGYDHTTKHDTLAMEKKEKELTGME